MKMANKADNKPKIVSIVGLTASGKSGLGIKLAQEFGGEIVSCDSRQVYKGLDIGTAKVTAEEQALVKHWLIDIVEPRRCKAAESAKQSYTNCGTGIYNVFEFQRAAYAAIDDILARGRVPFLVGGSGLYSRSIVDGYEFDAVTRSGSDAVILNGSEIRGNVKSKTGSPCFNVLQICLLPSREYIRGPVEQRIDQRLGQGMIEETRELIKQGVNKDFLQALGLEYYWNVEYIEGRVTKEQYKKNLATKTMQFAKRQRTWFKKERAEITHYLTDPEGFYEETKKLISLFLI